MSDIVKRPAISAADNNGDGPKDAGGRHHQGDDSHKDSGHHKLSLTKHDRRSPHDEDDDDDDDSPYHNSDDDEDNNHQSDDNSSVTAPDISIVKKEGILIILKFFEGLTHFFSLANAMDCSPSKDGKDVSSSNHNSNNERSTVAHKEDGEISPNTANANLLTASINHEVKPSIAELTFNRPSTEADLFDDVITDKVTSD